MTPNCPRAETADIVDDFALNQEKWKNVFLKAMTKMIENGYEDGQLNEPQSGWLKGPKEGCEY